MPTSSDPAVPARRRRAVLVTHDLTSVDDTGIIGSYLEGLGLEVIRHSVLPSGDFDPDVDLPATAGADLVVVFGSTEHAWEGHHLEWVQQEARWVRDIVDRGVPFLGICFGCQILALALGGEVRPAGADEIGMLRFPTSPDCPIPGGPWFSWHSDFVSLPDDVTVWSANDVGPQIFTSGSALGVQFHPEVSFELADAWITRVPALPEPWTADGFRRDVRENIASSQAGCRHLVDWVLDRRALTCG